MSSLRILIVDDSAADRALLKYLIEDHLSYEAKFREATTLETAFRYLDSGNIDCVLLDLQLPDSAGKETFTKIIERYPDVPIVILTHNRDRDLAIDMIRSGASDYILKTYTEGSDEVCRRILYAIE